MGLPLTVLIKPRATFAGAVSGLLMPAITTSFELPAPHRHRPSFCLSGRLAGNGGSGRQPDHHWRDGAAISTTATATRSWTAWLDCGASMSLWPCRTSVAKEPSPDALYYIGFFKALRPACGHARRQVAGHRPMVYFTCDFFQRVPDQRCKSLRDGPACGE
jgi:hypothetical protein